MSPKAAAAAKAPSNYFERSRGLAESFLAIAPLLAFYQAGIAITHSNIINGADDLLRNLFALLGPEAGSWAWRGLLAAAFIAAAVEVVRRGYPIHRDLALLMLEGLAFGALLGPAAIFLKRKIAPMLAAGVADQGAFSKAVMSIGAGVYEEIVFRLGLLSALYVIGRRASAAIDSSSVAAAGFAVAGSSLIFSGFHHWPCGEPFVLSTFVFRAIAGAILGVLFITRGLGVAVYTHAIYDLLVSF